MAQDTIDGALTRIFAVQSSEACPTVRGMADEVAEYRRSFLESAAELNALPEMQDMKEEHGLRMFALHRRQSAMLRAAIVFSDQTHSDVLRVVTGDNDVTVAKLNGRKHLPRFAALHRAALRKAYALRQFRNRIVTHPPDNLISAAGWSNEDAATMRLRPLRWNATLSHQEVADVHNLAKRCAAEVPAVTRELAGTGNVWTLLQLLFEGVNPIDANDTRSALRDEIDDVVGNYGGVQSPTMAGVFDTMIDFFTALADLVEAESGATYNAQRIT